MSNVDGTSAERRITTNTAKASTAIDRINDLLKSLIDKESLTTQQLQEYSRQFSNYKDGVYSEVAALEKKAQNMLSALRKAEAIASAIGLADFVAKKNRGNALDSSTMAMTKIMAQSERDGEYT